MVFFRQQFCNIQTCSRRRGRTVDRCRCSVSEWFRTTRVLLLSNLSVETMLRICTYNRLFPFFFLAIKRKCPAESRVVIQSVNFTLKVNIHILFQ